MIQSTSPFRFQVELRRIVKSFQAVKAIDKVSINVRKGEVVGVVGDNGAGKSTLMKILSGLIRPDSGEILWEGGSISLKSTHQARELGIEMIYQDLGLVDSLNAVENIFLGRELHRKIPRFWPLILDRKGMLRRSEDVLNKLAIFLPDLAKPVATLSGGQRQSIAIARALVFSPKVMIMDEPTAALAVKEVNNVLDIIRSLRAQSVSIILISHRLDDIFAVSDRIVVLYHGKKVADVKTEDSSRVQVMKFMLGLSSKKN